MRRAASLVVIFIFLICIPGCQKKRDEVGRQGLINFLNGKVSIVTEKGIARARVGDVLTRGMKVLTGTGSFAEIYFGENAVRVMENSEIEITELSADLSSDSEKTGIFLERGEIFSRISKKLLKGDAYEIKTPTTIAAVRGTDFSVSEKDKSGHVACLSGKVEVRDATSTSSEAVDLNAGQEVEVQPGKPLTVTDLSESNKKMINDLLNDISDMKADIRKRFEEEREKIREEVKSLKKKNREMVDEQKSGDKENIDNQKASDSANIEAVKGNPSADSAEMKKKIREQTESMKGSVEESRKSARDALDSVKPDLKNLKK